MPPRPMTLLLPFELADRFSLRELLGADRRYSAREAHRLLERFSLSGPERRFAIALLRAKTNLWLFRCNQSQFCGDFLVVDMSGPKALRRVHVLELKAREPARLLSGGGIQLANWREAVDEVAREHGILTAESAHANAQLVRGGEGEVLAFLGAA